MDYEFWLGSLSLYHAYISGIETAKAALASGAWTVSNDDDDDDEAEEPVNFSLFGNVGVVDVTGTLTNDDSWWNRYVGNTSYNQFRRSIIEAATHGSVKAVVMNIDSGGGTPNGLADASDLVRQISSTGMPVYTYSGGVMASAAYWLGSAGDKVYCGETADVGSIGVISIHREITEMLKQQGIKATVLRSGTEKALGNMFEKLSEKAREGMQSRMDALYDVFINRIAMYRDVPPEYVREHMANGREFIGQQALDAGLVDGISTLDDLIMGLQSKIDKQAANGKETSIMAKKSTVLTQAQRDAMLEGVAPGDALNINTPEDGKGNETKEPDAPEVKAETEVPEEKPNTTEPALNSDAGAGAGDQLIAFLRTELAAKNQEVVQLNTQLAELNREMTSLQAVHEPMKKLVAASISRMQVALGAPMMDMSDMPAELVLSQHTKLHEVFCSKFPVGGVAAVQAEDSQKPAAVSSVSAARMRQAKI